MEVCDICAREESGVKISAQDIREAVKKGFDPVRLNLLPRPPGSSASLPSPRAVWEFALNSSTDWNVCGACMKHVGPYLPMAARTRLGIGGTTTKPTASDDPVAMLEESMKDRGWTPEMRQLAMGKLRETMAEQTQKKSCFIATAACGVASPEVEILRRFRDTRLVNSRAGVRFIAFYERWSPPLARAVQSQGVLRWLVRTLIIRPIARFLSTPL